MKRYFIEGKEVTEAEAKEFERLCQTYLESDNLDDWLKIRFIFCIEV